jgi:NAD(P)-dependent dehydrogenase (short-subunit alcohol dehydrogenase family)
MVYNFKELFMANANALVIGGTSGLGMEISLLLAKANYKVFATGRKNISEEAITRLNLDISSDTQKLSADLDRVLAAAKPLQLLVYAAGFYQGNPISELSDSDITAMINVGLLAPALLLQKILRAQNKLPEFIAITSTSQWIPRPREPVYASVKAGLATLAHSVSLDANVEKTLVVGPGGMRTDFWKGAPRENNGSLLAPRWVAENIMKLREGKFKYRLARIPRDPPRVELLEELK